MKTILCAIDYSENSLSALKYAYGLSSKIDARLVVIYVFNIPTLSSDLDEPFFPFEEDILKKRQSRLEEFCTKNLAINLKKMNIKAEAVENNLAVNGIVSKASELQANLLITGMRGEHLFKDFFIGNTTQQLLEKAPCPVLAIPNNCHFKELKTIVYATDFEEEDIDAVNELISNLKPLKPTIKMVHISSKIEYDSKLLMEWFKELLKQKVHYKNIEFEVVFSEDIFNSLKTYLKDSKADLVGMTERKKTGFLKTMFHRDLVKKMESLKEIPLMSFNEENY